MIPENHTVNVYTKDESQAASGPDPSSPEGISKYAAPRLNINVSGNSTNHAYFIETELLPGERVLSEFVVEMPPPINMFKFVLKIILTLGLYLLMRVLCSSCLPISVTNKKYRMSLTNHGRILIWCLNIDGQQAAEFTWTVTRFLTCLACCGKCADECVPGREYACLTELHAYSVHDVMILDHEAGRKEIPFLSNLCPEVFRFSRNVLNIYLRRFPDPATFIENSFFASSKRILPSFKGEGSYSGSSSIQAITLLGRKTLLMVFLAICAIAYLIGSGQTFYGVALIFAIAYAYAFLAPESSFYSVNTNLPDERHHNNSVKISILSTNHDILHSDSFSTSTELCHVSKLILEMKSKCNAFSSTSAASSRASSRKASDFVEVQVSSEDVPVIDLSLTSILSSNESNLGRVCLSTLNVPLTEADIAMQAPNPNLPSIANTIAAIPYFGRSSPTEFVLPLVIIFLLFFCPFAVFGDLKAGLGLGIFFGIIIQALYYYFVIRKTRGIRGVILLFKDRIVEYAVNSVSGLRSSIDSTYAMNCTTYFVNNGLAHGQMKVSGDATSGRITDVYGNKLEFVGIGKKQGQAQLQSVIRYFHSKLTSNMVTMNSSTKQAFSSIASIRPTSAFGGDTASTVIEASDSTNITSLFFASPTANTIGFVDSPKKFEDIKLAPFILCYVAWAILFTLIYGSSTKSTDAAFLLWWITSMFFQVENWSSALECKVEFASSSIFGQLFKKLLTMFFLCVTLGRYPQSHQSAMLVSDETVQFIKRKSNYALIPWYRLNRPIRSFSWDKIGLFSRFKGQYDVTWIPTSHVRGVSLAGQVEGNEVCLSKYFASREPFNLLCPLMSTITRIALVSTHQDGDKELNFIIEKKRLAADSGSLEDEDIREFRSKISSIVSIMSSMNAVAVEDGPIEVQNAGIYGYMAGGVVKQPSRPDSATTNTSGSYEKEML